MASIKYKGTGTVASADFHAVKWEGVTKAGKPVRITMEKAINMSDIDWTFAEKSETVPQIVFEGCYENTDEASTSNDEPWTIEMESVTGAAGDIILGQGVFYIDNKKVALTRGGGSFKTGRVFRNINADGDRGAVVDRITIDEARPQLTLNVLNAITNFSDMYAALKTVQ